MNNSESLGICFFGLSSKDLAIFDRVIAFIEKKDKKFHKCDARFADILVINDDQEARKLTAIYQQSHTIISVSTRDDCPIGDYKIKRPLLITRVMRAMDGSSKLCEQLKLKDNKPNQPLLIREDQLKDKKNICSQESDQTPNFRALVVDDSAAIRKQLEIELRETSITADYASCGKEALEKINNKQYDLIFLDLIMPDIDGYTVCKQLRQKKNYKRTPVIMLSGKTEPLDEVDGILAGASTYLRKPVKHDNFQKTLQRISKWLDEYA